MYFKTAEAIAYPSKVDVPLPSSSRIAIEFLVPYFTTFKASSISIKNVDFPYYKLSDAPILVNILSTIPI